jgi:hypothetical protein
VEVSISNPSKLKDTNVNRVVVCGGASPRSRGRRMKKLGKRRKSGVFGGELERFC